MKYTNERKASNCSSYETSSCSFAHSVSKTDAQYRWGKKSHFLISTFCCVQKEDRFFRCCPSQPRPLLLPQTRLPRGLPGQHHGRPHCPRQPQHPPPHSGHQHAAKPRPPETPGPSQPLTGQTPASSRWQQRRHPLQPSDWPKP